MRQDFTYQITTKDEGKTVQQFLMALGYSRHLMIDLKKTSTGLMIQGLQVYVTRRLKAGDILNVQLPADISSEKIVPTAMDLNILYEDDDLLVIQKAAGLPIHPSQGNFTNTLANGMAWYFMQKGEPFVYRVINRLDRDTTGLLILAKHALSACILSEMIRNRAIHRTYLAAVNGDVRELSQANPIPRGLNRTVREDTVSYSISAPIVRVSCSTIERQVDWKQGESACTHFSVLSYHQKTGTSLIQLNLETGRTHQIRVHMKYLGYPLHGDFLYNPDYRFIKRQSLHSWKLEFNHPITKEPLFFMAAIPDDMKLFFDINNTNPPLS